MSGPEPVVDREDEGADDEGAELQFDQAEMTTPASSGPSCDACKRPITDTYYEINRKILCSSCRERIEASFQGGSGLARFLKASLFGFGAALVGAAIYYTCVRVTGSNFGLVAILVGFMIGWSVRKGTGNRGGLLYQFLALFMTYFAIGVMCVTFAMEHQFKELQGMIKDDKPKKEAPAKAVKNEKGAGKTDDRPQNAIDVAGKDKAKDLTNPKTEKAKVTSAKAPNAAPKKNAAVAKTVGDGTDVPTVGGLVGATVIVLAGVVLLTLAYPVLMAFQFPISGLIYCFALFQAWQMNKGAKLAFSGPFQVAAAPPALETRDDHVG